jgi:DNA-binding transcriptional ArsR family regulator
VRTVEWSAAKPKETGLEAPLRDALEHPLKARLLIALAERPDVTIRQMAERLGETPRRVRHQVGALVDAGLAEVSSEVSRRGVVERHYSSRVEVDFPSTDMIGPELRLRCSQEIVRLLLGDIGVASSAGTFATAPDRCECRFYGEVDERCLEELVEVHARVYREIGEIVSAGRDRVRETGEPGTEIVSALLFFDAALWGTTGK